MIKELKTILYVEDDLHVRTTAKLVLEVLGKFEVRDCGSGREALHAARDFQPLVNIHRGAIFRLRDVHVSEQLSEAFAVLSKVD